MRPLRPKEREAILKANPKATPQDIDEYERLLTEHANSHPDERDEDLESRLRELALKLFPEED